MAQAGAALGAAEIAEKFLEKFSKIDKSKWKEAASFVTQMEVASAWQQAESSVRGMQWFGQLMHPIALIMTQIDAEVMAGTKDVVKELFDLLKDPETKSAISAVSDAITQVVLAAKDMGALEGLKIVLGAVSLAAQGVGDQFRILRAGLAKLKAVFGPILTDAEAFTNFLKQVYTWLSKIFLLPIPGLGGGAAVQSPTGDAGTIIAPNIPLFPWLR